MKTKILISLLAINLAMFMNANAQTGCNTPPILTSLNVTNDCYAPSVNLNSLFGGTVPNSTSSLVWYTNSTHSGAEYANPTNAIAGTYYAYFYDAAFNCFSPSSEPVHITIAVCPCTTAASSATAINADINGTPLSSGKYHITKDITIDGNITFNQIDFYIEPGVTITIAPTANVTFKFAHLHCCNGMWQGINVLPGGRLALIEDVDFATVIEDAVVAVNYNYPNPNSINTTASYLLHTSGAVFNRNETGIKISNLYYNIAMNGQLPFYIAGSIFTSRDITFDYSVPWGALGNRLDLAFSYTDATNSGVSNPRPPNTLSAPFFNNPMFPSPDNTIDAFLKRGIRDEKPSFGILLDNLCEGDAHFMRVGNKLFGTYATLPYNLFDNMDIGIDASSAKLFVNNCIFQKKHPKCPSGIGINLHNNGTVALPRLTVNNLDNFGNATTMQNSFYNLGTAININNYSSVNISGCNIRSSQSRIAPYNLFGNAGIIMAGAEMTDINIIDNNISNITSPIIYTDLGVSSSLQKNINIVDNHIFAQLPNATPTNNEFINTAIALTGNGVFTGGTPDLLPLICSRNVIQGAYNGIKATDFIGKSLDFQLNNITLSQAPLKRNKIQEQFGIRLNNGSPAINNGGAIRSVVQNNLVTGSSVGGNICTNCNQTGIYSSNNHLTDVNCNKAENLTHGFRFLDLNNVTKFFDNNIEPTNLYGFTLDQNAMIGHQGHNRTGVKCNSDNSWKVPRSSWSTNYGTTHFMTLVRNATPTSSKLYVRNTNTTNPDLGGTFIGTNIPSLYTTASGSIVTQNPTFNTCTHCVHSSSNPNTDAAIAYEDEVQVLEYIADGTIELIDDDPATRLFVLQQQLYEQLQLNGNNYANSTTLQNFMNNSGVSSFDYIYYVQQYLNDGNLAAVDLLLGYFPNNNQVEQNYITYYSWMANMLDSPAYRPDTEEVFAMASLCPAKNGNVVYKARALYNKLTNTQDEVFSDECPESIAARGIRPTLQLEEPKINTSYIVYPNPVKDVFNINNKDMERFVITDITGRVVMAQKCVGVQRETIDISQFQKGIYIIHLYKTDNSFITQKLIKQ